MRTGKVMIVTYGSGGSEIMAVLTKGSNGKLFGSSEIYLDNINMSKYAQDKNGEGVYVKMGDLKTYIKNSMPTAIINERSNGIEFHEEIEDLCKKLNIPTICVTDMYGGYDKRFEVEPDYIITPSMSIYREIHNAGVDRNKLFVGGNPAFDSIYDEEYCKEINRKKPRIVYTSQGKNYEGSFAKVYKALENTFEEFILDIKLHPQEDEYSKYSYEQYKNITVIEIDNRKDFIPECLKYDMVAGYGSTIQIKTNLIGIPTVFLGREHSHEDLFKMFRDNTKLPRYPYDDFEKDATYKVRRIIREIVETL